jgi:hypothetical protein
MERRILHHIRRGQPEKKQPSQAEPKTSRESNLLDSRRFTTPTDVLQIAAPV